ncbi:MAG: [protein-PII] uridylyltransferase [Jatrophihabitans sp.]|uniref:[protein-PII] uridylyltransferase n=1 Tax=Jatrophihabitans sp. TaxID=1932789 RepID=UPI003F7EA0C4
MGGAGFPPPPGLVASGLREALTEAYDGWLQQVVELPPGVALVAVGGLGRKEPAPFGDLDLVLLHDGDVDGLGELADRIWYPIWDARIGLDHSVRTPEQAVAVAKDDLKALLGLLDIRHISGDAGLTGRVRSGVLELWRATAARRLPEMRELSQARWAIAGEAAFLLEPNIKESRGGLRDAQAVHALAAAQLVDFPVRVREQYPVLLDVRGELQRVTGRAEDVLRKQEHDAVAAALGIEHDETGDARDVLLRRINEAARVVAHALDLSWRRVEAQSAAARPRFRLLRGRPTGPERVGLARNVVAQDGEVVLARDADPWADTGLVLRVARASAEHDLPIAPFTLERLAAESGPLPTPWPRAVLDDLVSTLATGRAGVTVLEALDDAGLLVRLIPEWESVRFRAQHDPIHRYTVDRHLLETAAMAAALDETPARPDVLLVGCLLHDIGKGYPGGDHSVTGADRARPIAERMGFTGRDLELVVGLVRHHLLLPNTATRRDIDDPRTIEIVATSVDGSAELLALLHALARADAAATSPAAWSDWKAGLIAQLVARTRAVLQGEQPPPPVPPLDDERRALAEQRELAIRLAEHDAVSEVLVAAPDSVGVLYRTAGVLALHSLDVREASIRTHDGMAVNRFVVEPRFGRLPDPTLMRNDLARALEGRLGLADKLREKERTYSRRPDDAPKRRPSVLWFDDATDATVLEYRGEDEIGLLFRITAALERCGVDIRSARLSSVAGSVVDAFYVTGRDGGPIEPPLRRDIEQALAAL